MTPRGKEGLFSAAGYLCCAVDELRAAGFWRLADRVDRVIAALDREIASENARPRQTTVRRGPWRTGERSDERYRRLTSPRSPIRALR